MRRELVAAIVVGMGWAIFVPSTALATPGFRSTIGETSLEKVGYLRRQSRRYWRNGYPVPYAYYPPAYGYSLPPPAYAYYPPYGYAPPPPPSGTYSPENDYGEYPPENGYGEYPPEGGYGEYPPEGGY
jgi:hypothetical protein